MRCMIYIMKRNKISDLDMVTLEELFNQRVVESYYRNNQPLPEMIEAIHTVQKVWNEILFEEEVCDTMKNYDISIIIKGLEVLEMDHCIETMTSFYENPNEDKRVLLNRYYDEIDFEHLLFNALQRNEELVVSFLNID